MNRGNHDWIQTYSGRQFWPLAPAPEDVFIEDIAHALSNICRYAGHCRSFYSVAQHSVLVALNCPPEHQLAGLLHDAAEAYIIDMPRPIKHDESMKAYREIEKNLEAVIFDKFGLPNPLPLIVKRIDDALLTTERRDLMATPPIPWASCHEAPLPEKIEPWSPEFAEKRFLYCYRSLTLQVPIIIDNKMITGRKYDAS